MDGGGWGDRHSAAKEHQRSIHIIHGVHITIFCLIFAECVVLPSLSSYLAAFHSDSSMLGLCLAAYCVGELITAPLFAVWYNSSPVRGAAMASLGLSFAGSILYAVAPNAVVVLLSRLLVGGACGIEGCLLSMAGGLCPKDMRMHTVSGVKALHTAAFILANGMAAVATFVHTPAPGPLGHIDHSLPKYVKMIHLNGTSEFIPHLPRGGLGSLGGMVIPPDGGSSRHLLLSVGELAEGELGGFSWTGGAGEGVGEGVQGGGGPAVELEGGGGGGVRQGPARPAKEGGGGGVGRGGRDAGRGGGREGRARDFGIGLGLGSATKEVRHGLNSLGKNIQDVDSAMGRNLGEVDKETSRDLGMGRIRGDGGGVEARHSGVKTDKEIAREIGDHRMYMPQYLTAVVGHGLRAPGYLGALVALCGAVAVWRLLVDVPSQAAVDPVPVSSLNPRSLAQFSPMVACIVMETFVQIWLSSVVTIVPPITGIYLGFTIDATAVFMMGIAASGVVGVSLSEAMKRKYPVRGLMLYSSLTSLAGILLCIPWLGELSAVQYALGCYMCAMGLYPLSSMATQVFSRCVGRACSDGKEVAWMGLFWSVSSAPARIAGPLLFSHALEFDQSASLCYLALLLGCVISLSLFLLHRRNISSAHAEADEPAGGYGNYALGGSSIGSYGSFLP